MQDLSGNNIQGYELKERIGTGGYGAVYRAYQTTVDREVAIKIILPGFANQPDFIQRFEVEARMIARLEHPHITPLYDYWRDPDGAYLVMRYLRGGSLRDRLAEKHLDVQALQEIFPQIALALAFAHRNGVIHRDLKPGNILLDEDDNAYLSDFGIAQTHPSQENSDPNGQTIHGSLGYLAPEQAQDGSISPQTDIYSLGVMLYELLTGEHPFPNLTPVERLYKHLNEPIPYIEALEMDQLEQINAVIQKATAKNPAHRYPDTLEMLTAVDEALTTTNQQLSPLPLALTIREKEVLYQITTGKTNKEIARVLVIAFETVKWYVRQIYKKLGVHNRSQAILKARELKLDRPPTSQFDTNDDAIGTERVTISPIPPPVNPFKGLRAFQTHDSQDFFGREKLTERLIQRLATGKGIASRFVVLVGPSGSGKSSVVKAGVIPAIWQSQLPGSDRWFTVEMTPSTHPVDELETTLKRIAGNQVGNLNESLRRDELGLHRVAQLTLPDQDRELFIVIDQFEEVFSSDIREPDRDLFLALLQTAVSHKNSRVRIIITLRADMFDRPLRFPTFGELIQNHVETVLPLTAPELEQAIIEPAKRAGVGFEDGLVSAIVSDIRYQPGALPLLQYALTELFDQRDEMLITHELYDELGRATGALARRADGIYFEFDEDGRQLTRQLFLRLVTLGEGTEDTRRRVKQSELLTIAQDVDLIEDILYAFVDSRLLSIDYDPSTRSPIIELAHEALLREWERLRIWLNESREDIRMERMLSTAASEWVVNQHKTGYLLFDERLSTFANWSQSTDLILTAKQQEYLRASVEHQQAREAQEAAQIQREVALRQRARSRLQWLVAILAIATVLTSLLAITAFDQRQIAENERESAIFARQTSVYNEGHAREEAAVNRSLVLASTAEEALLLGETDVALALALQAVDVENPPPTAINVLRAVTRHPGTMLVIDAFESPVSFLRLSSDGQYIVASANETDLSSSDHHFRMWNTTTGEEKRIFSGHTEAVQNAVFSPDGQLILSMSGSVFIDNQTSGVTDIAPGELILWNIQDGHVIWRISEPEIVFTAISFTPDGSQILVSQTDDEGNTSIRLLDTESAREIRRYPSDFDKAIRGVVILPDESRFVAYGDTNMIIAWDLDSGEEIAHYELEDVVRIKSVAVHPNGDSLIIAPLGLELIGLDLSSGAIIRREAISPGVNDPIFLDEGEQFAIWQGGAIVIKDTETWEEIVRFGSHRSVFDSEIRIFDYQPFTNRLVTGDTTGEIRIWELDSGQNHRVFETDGTPLAFLTQNSDGTELITGSLTGDLIFWDVQTGQETRRFHDENGGSIGPSFSADDRFILYGAGDRFGPTENTTLLIWDASTGEVLQTFEGHNTYVRAAAFSPDGRSVLAGSQALVRSSYDLFADLILWDVASGKPIRYFDTNQDISSVVFSKDGIYAFTTSSFTPGADMWDVNTGKRLRRFVAHSQEVFDLALSPDETTMATSSNDGSIILWDIETGDILQRFLGHEAGVWTVDIHPNGNLLISADQNGEVILWDISTGHILDRLGQHSGLVTGALFSKDGTRAYSVSFDGSLIEWSIDVTSVNKLVEWIQNNRFVRALNNEEQARYLPVIPQAIAAFADTPTTPTPITTTTPTPLATTTPTITPIPIVQAQAGEQRGEIGVNEYDIWSYTATTGEIISISMIADRPAMGQDAIEIETMREIGALHTQLIVRNPEGQIIIASSDTDLITDEETNMLTTNTQISNVTFPEAGTYTIEARSFRNLTGGAYTLEIESSSVDE